MYLAGKILSALTHLSGVIKHCLHVVQGGRIQQHDGLQQMQSGDARLVKHMFEVQFLVLSLSQIQRDSSVL